MPGEGNETNGVILRRNGRRTTRGREEEEQSAKRSRLDELHVSLHHAQNQARTQAGGLKGSKPHAIISSLRRCTCMLQVVRVQWEIQVLDTVH